jgi:ABC-type glutathione transport system ATPase component
MINAWRDRESSSNFTVLQPTGTKEIACRRKYHKDFVAFDDISFEVKNGETPGIIGLKWCGEVKAFFRSSPVFAIPDKGTIQVDDKVTGLREHLHERHPYRHVKGRARPGKSRRSSTSPSSAISSTNPSRPIRPG